MKVAMFHDGKGVSMEAKASVASEIKRYRDEQVYIKTAPIDNLKDFFEDIPQSNEKVSLVVFVSIPYPKVRDAVEQIGKTGQQKIYFVRIGESSIGNSVDESVKKIEDWNAQKFLEAIT